MLGRKFNDIAFDINRTRVSHCGRRVDINGEGEEFSWTKTLCTSLGSHCTVLWKLSNLYILPAQNALCEHYASRHVKVQKKITSKTEPRIKSTTWMFKIANLQNHVVNEKGSQCKVNLYTLLACSNYSLFTWHEIKSSSHSFQVSLLSMYQEE